MEAKIGDQVWTYEEIAALADAAMGSGSK